MLIVKRIAVTDKVVHTFTHKPTHTLASRAAVRAC